MDFKRTHYIGQLDSSMEGKNVVVGGWVEDIRELGKLTFLTLRDVTGVAQIVLVGEDSLKQTKGLTRQSVIKVTGTIQKSKARDFAYEIKSNKIDILTIA
ncbi:MAG: OB-fold nucleic acid binding domain-containing protein, partial [Nitrosopumilaceae archaeon]